MMKRRAVLKHEFVRTLPESLEDGTLYISVDYATVAHRCCCGCRHEVVTPLSPTDWRMIYDGVSVSLYPSVGNWGFGCQSHYWIERSRVIWAPRWSKRMITQGQERDARLKKAYYEGRERANSAEESEDNR
jgi:hypothetical protein